MKVRTAFTFEDRTLRTIRAALGRGGVATRKDCVTFIERAVAQALAGAPTPKPARTKRPTPVVTKVAEPVVPQTEEEQATAARRSGSERCMQSEKRCCSKTDLWYHSRVRAFRDGHQCGRQTSRVAADGGQLDNPPV